MVGGESPDPAGAGAISPHPAALFPVSSGKAEISLLPSPPGLCLARDCTSAGACVCKDVV